eukprot:TRINITY_DN50182_c0_g1_i1.p1 TRINITY_DN50182_c0_g1~~TRINITY_DN50182_c0_g1_i1.p1  ORF type:complete len:468 (+),score=81.50 TRINITY_DN50182_c0_g1_i1:162-1565(+)
MCIRDRSTQSTGCSAGMADAASGPSCRRHSMVVLGATGFTGLRVAQRLQASLEGCKPAVAWAIAGRNQERLDQVLAELPANAARPEVLIADVDDANSLRAMAESCSLVLNCVGPYRFLGEPVVKACVEAGTDYVDLCGEPEFMDRMLLEWHDAAVAAGVYIVHACAFDSVPADLGLLYTAEQFMANGGLCSAAESFLLLHSGPAGMGGHVTTYESAVHGFGSQDRLHEIRQDLKIKYPSSVFPLIGPKLARRGGMFWEDRCERYGMPFPGSDAAVVRNSQRILLSRGECVDRRLTPQYAAYIGIESCWWKSIVCCCGALFQCCAGCACGRSCLLGCPGCFSCGSFSSEGPSPEQLSQTSFTMRFYASGFASRQHGEVTVGDPDMRMVTEVRGPEPGYVATPIVFVELAKCLLEERDALCGSGGVFTPGGLFYESTLIERLGMAGVTFEVVDVSIDPLSPPVTPNPTN